MPSPWDGTEGGTDIPATCPRRVHHHHHPWPQPGKEGPCHSPESRANPLQKQSPDPSPRKNCSSNKVQPVRTQSAEEIINKLCPNELISVPEEGAVPLDDARMEVLSLSHAHWKDSPCSWGKARRSSHRPLRPHPAPACASPGHLISLLCPSVPGL